MNTDLFMLIISIMSIVLSGIIIGYLNKQITHLTHDTTIKFIVGALMTIIPVVIIHMNTTDILLEINYLCWMMGNMLMMISVVETKRKTTKHSKEHYLITLGMIMIMLEVGLGFWLQQNAFI